jgi:outer membrane protein assembly factor BamB
MDGFMRCAAPTERCAGFDGAVSLDVAASETPPRYVGPIVAGGKVYVVSRDGAVQAFDADAGRAGEIFATGQDILTPPQIAGGRMFLVGRNGTLIAVE